MCVYIYIYVYICVLRVYKVFCYAGHRGRIDLTPDRARSLEPNLVYRAAANLLIEPRYQRSHAAKSSILERPIATHSLHKSVKPACRNDFLMEILRNPACTPSYLAVGLGNLDLTLPRPLRLRPGHSPRPMPGPRAPKICTCPMFVLIRSGSPRTKK